MNSRAMPVLMALAASCGLSMASTPEQEQSLDLARAQQQVFHAAARAIAPSVVTIETIGGTQPGEPAPTASLPGGMPRPRARPSGAFIVADGPTTGLVWSEDGLILTSAFNFVRNPSLISVVLQDGRRFVAELLAKDELRQLAMLRIQATELPVPRWVDSPAEIRVGQWVLALGRGFGGTECSISAGIVSGLNRQAGFALQTDAKLSPANFGGPLIDLDGRVVGLCVPMGMTIGRTAGVELYDSGIGFSIPSWQVRAAAKDLEVGHTLRHGMLGIIVDPTSRAGVRVEATADPSPARTAGMAPGDRIVAIEGEPVDDFRAMQRLLRRHPAGTRVTVRAKREEEELDLLMRLAVPEDLGPIVRPRLRPDTQPTDTQPDDDF